MASSDLSAIRPPTRTQVAGDRHVVQVVGVDSGTMTIAAGLFPSDTDGDDIFDRGVRHNRATSSTGWGDGGYEVALVKGADSQVLGVEVVFLCEPISTAVEAALEVAGINQESDELLADLSTGRASEADRASYRARNQQIGEIAEQIWNEALPTTHPADGATPEVIGQINVTNHVGIGDPCYGGPSCVVDLPAGTYTAVTWMDTESEGRVARLGIYHLDD